MILLLKIVGEKTRPIGLIGLGSSIYRMTTLTLNYLEAELQKRRHILIEEYAFCSIFQL